MARIIYGVTGQGFGHSARSKEVLNYLTKAGHQVLVFSYDQGLFFLKDKFDTFEIPGLRMSYKNNKVVYWNTILMSVRQIAKQSKDWSRILDRFRRFAPDLVITDFEPLTALLAKLQRVPLISLDNQHQLTNTKVEVPKKYRKDLLADKLIIKSMVWKANYYLITSFFKTPVTRKKTFIFPAVIRREILELTPEENDFILVYQTSDFNYLVDKLEEIDQKFIVFGFDINKKIGNIEFRKFSNKHWLDCLAGCRAIIGNAGSSLSGEAVYLQKPYLAIPINRQIEQIINAYYLEKMGCGKFFYKFSPKIFQEFVNSLDEFKKNLSQYQEPGNQEVFKKLAEIIKEFE